MTQDVEGFVPAELDWIGLGEVGEGLGRAKTCGILFQLWVSREKNIKIRKLRSGNLSRAFVQCMYFFSTS